MGPINLMMFGAIRERVLPLAALLGACAVVPAAVIHFLGGEPARIPSGVHFLPIVVASEIRKLVLRRRDSATEEPPPQRQPAVAQPTPSH